MEARAADCDVTAYVQPSSAEAFSETPTAFGHLIVLPCKCLVAFVLVQTVDGAEKLLLPFNPTFAESVGERSLMVELQAKDDDALVGLSLRFDSSAMRDVAMRAVEELRPTEN